MRIVTIATIAIMASARTSASINANATAGIGIGTGASAQAPRHRRIHGPLARGPPACRLPWHGAPAPGEPAAEADATHSGTVLAAAGATRAASTASTAGASC